MSKQLKLKFKKLLKKADFIHADLEYHEELVVEAKQLFNEELQKWLRALPQEEQKRLHAIAMAQQSKRRARDGDEKNEISSHPDPAEGSMSLIELEKTIADEPDEAPLQINKEKELKKLFYRIAERTHPDKAVAKGTTEEEVKRLEKLFRTALTAHKNENWYVLYCIASDLNIDLGDIAPEQLEWIEEDIRRALGAIAQIAHLVVWVWYVGDDTVKEEAVRSYFLQTYDYDYPAT